MRPRERTTPATGRQDLPQPEPWRAKAMEKVWECRTAIDAAELPMELWLELADAFSAAHARPARSDFIRAVWEFAAWCAPSGDGDIENAVGCAFLERLAG